MAIKTYKPYTASRRNMTGSAFTEITKSTPEKSLTVRVKNTAGRNSYGKITVRHRGGGSKKLYRIIDFKRNKDNIPAKVTAIEYDPNRSANIALLAYADGEKRYILAPEGLKVGQVIYSGDNAEIRVGNSLPLRNIPDVKTLPAEQGNVYDVLKYENLVASKAAIEKIEEVFE